jgi:hypothetical protein
MSDTVQNGKGDAPRPLSVSWDTFRENWDLIFKSKDPSLQDQESLLDSIRETLIETSDETEKFI